MDDTTHGERVKASILATGLALWPDVSARRIARTLGMTHGGCLYHFGTAAALHDAIAAEAVRVGDVRVVPQLIASRHPAAAAISAADRRRFLAGV